MCTFMYSATVTKSLWVFSERKFLCWLSCMPSKQCENILEKFQTKRVWALQASVYDYDESDDHDLIGEFTLNVPQMLQAVDREVPL